MTLLLQATVCDGLSEESQSSIEHVLDTAGHWSAYKIARQATRYGHHHLASLIFGKLVNKVKLVVQLQQGFINYLIHFGQNDSMELG